MLPVIHRLQKRLEAEEEARMQQEEDAAGAQAASAWRAMPPEPVEAPKLRAKLAASKAKMAEIRAKLAVVQAEAAQVEGELNMLTHVHTTERNRLFRQATPEWRLARAMRRMTDAIEKARTDPKHFGIPDLMTTLFEGQRRLGCLRDGIDEFGLEDPDEIVDRALAAFAQAYETGEPIRRARIESQEKDRRRARLLHPAI